MAEQERLNGTLLSSPSMTGDGVYEAVIADPDGNRVELVGGSLENRMPIPVAGSLSFPRLIIIY